MESNKPSIIIRDLLNEYPSLPFIGLIIVVLLWLLMTCSCAPVADKLRADQLRILNALQVVEVGSLDATEWPDGDGGKAIGPFQIHRSYWQDALWRDPSLEPCYSLCKSLPYARRVVEAYMRHYCPAAWDRADAEIIARTHNGGPRGPQRASTLSYWIKVKRALSAL